jgi:hypothetical protein
MTKNPEFAKHASEIARAQDSIRSANEELIKLSQRLGRMMPKLQRLETSGIITWFSIYNRIKDGANRADDELTSMLNYDLGNYNPVFQSQLAYYMGQRSRFYSKVEVMDDILNGIMEDLLENGSFEESQKEEMRTALDGTMEKSRRKIDAMPVLA